ncbi:PaaI family thioesterase [Nocardia sp. NPDC058058]|uniref:PaaI family thioesterase n=1 Tax=Nocardia sp. NPDC058058 TaxID=3346317 RepID=UPI0036DEA4F7
MTVPLDTLTIPDYIHGYPELAFGGYVAGMLAARSGAPTVRVDFRRAVGISTPVLLAAEDGNATLSSPDGTLLVEAAPAILDLDVPPTPSWAEAKTATETALSSPHRRVSDCYGCGVACAPGRGVRLFAWAVPERRVLTAAWTPDPGLAVENGELTTESVWSALDCPGGLAAWIYSGMAPGAFTAALTATQFQPIHAGTEYISHAWPISGEGRKHTVGVALSTPEGELCAVAEALWIEPRTTQPDASWT